MARAPLDRLANAASVYIWFRILGGVGAVVLGLLLAVADISSGRVSPPPAPPAAPAATVARRVSTNVLCPDGSWVRSSSGSCTLAPDGHYVGGSPSRLAPDGSWIGPGHPVLCPDGHWAPNRCVLMPDGRYR